MQCTATSKRTGQRCRDDAMVGKAVCYHHGGKTPRGRGSVHYTHGRYSSALPTRLKGRYEAAVDDPDLLVLREDIALIDVRVADQLARVDSGESGSRWLAARLACERLVAMRGTPGEQEALQRLEAAINGGAADYSAWSDIRTCIEQRRRLVDSERRRLVEASQMITAEQAMVLLDRVVDTVRRHVTDRQALVAISNELARLAHVPERNGSG